MKRYLLVGGVIALLVLISFGVVEALEIPLLTDPSDVIEGGGWLAAALGVGLLLADVFIPVPSSIVMIAHGAAFGILGGFLLSFVASVGGATIGWWVGRQGSAWMRRFVKEAEQAQADAFLARYGIVAVILSRMLPVLAETVAVTAGAAGMPWPRFLLASALGSIPPALVYALVGSVTTQFAPGALIAAGVFLLAGLGWWISRRQMAAARPLPEQSPR